jgi:dihydroorotate dehydrogenase
MPNSKAAMNWLGLPNLGYEEIAKRIGSIERKPNCPIGISLSSAPEETGDIALNNLLNGFQLFEKTKVDFIELNESCPNVPHEQCESTDTKLDSKLLERLEFISEKFLKLRTRNLPVIVKFSNDTAIDQISDLVRILVELGYDGINLGNTSTNYENYKQQINLKELENYEYFTKEFGGGLSGHPLKSSSLTLSKEAVKTINELYLRREFIVIRTGGFEDIYDFVASENSKIHLNQWFTGYFDMFAQHGHNVYKSLFNL